MRYALLDCLERIAVQGHGTVSKIIGMLREFGRPGYKAFLILFLVFVFLSYSLVIEPSSLVVTRNSFDLID
ncbi:MAG: hypothetical protein V1827_06690, partial [Candidatus Micrarchaeota archaeon]